jgi:hypothetical protein
LPHPQVGDEKTALDIRPAPRLAREVVARLESPPGEGMCIHRQAPGMKTIRNQKTNQEVEMNETRESSPDFGAIAWGALFILWGITEMFKSLPEGIGAMGIGMILLSLNLARSRKGQPTSGFTITFGILALLLGTLQLARPYLQLTFELPIFAILLLTLGLILLGSALKGSKNHG